MLGKNKDIYLGPILVIVAALLWALDGVLRRNLHSLPPITIIFFEHLIGLLILIPFVYKLVLKDRLGRREWSLAFIISVLSGLLGTLWFTTAILKTSYISFSVVFLLQKLQPLFAITTAVVFLKEKLNNKYIAWAFLALGSAYFVTFPSGVVNLSTGEGTVLAALFALGAAFAWGSSTTFSKMLLNKVDARVSTFYRFLLTTIIAFPVVLLMGKGASLSMPTASHFALFAVIAVSSGMLALLIYYRGLSRTPVRVTTILELTYPFVAILIDMGLYGTKLTLSQWLSSFVLVYSIYRLVELREKNN